MPRDAMGGPHQTVNRHSGITCCACSNASTPCLSLWERWLSEARTERVYETAIPSQSPSVTALPEGEPRGCTDTLRSLFYDHPPKSAGRVFDSGVVDGFPEKW